MFCNDLDEFLEIRCINKGIGRSYFLFNRRGRRGSAEELSPGNCQPVYPLTYSLAHSPTCPLVHLFTFSPVHLPTCPLVRSSVCPLSSFPPTLPIERTVIDRFGQVFSADIRSLAQVGERAGNFQYAVKCPGR